MNKKIKKFAVLGHPIKHSLSPQIHSLFANEFSIDLEYKKIDIDQEDFFDSIASLKNEGFYGLNITMPLKYLAFQICNEVTERSSLCKSVNTITFSDKKIIGDSTDGRGLINDLNKKSISIDGKNILLVGAGGAASGVIYDLIQGKPKQIFLTNRTINKASKMQEYWKLFADKNQVILKVIDLNLQKRINFDLVINATSASLSSEDSPISNSIYNCLTNLSVCYDMMYGSKTPFMKEAYKKTDLVYDGIGMLVEQAAVSFNIWHHLNPITKNIEEDLKSL